MVYQINVEDFIHFGKVFVIDAIQKPQKATGIMAVGES
jgi:hypothetical protein